MTTIGFVRHGVTAWNKEGRAQGTSDVPLDQDGIEMARRVALRLEQEEWDVIYTSPLMRAKQTADIIVERQKNFELLEDIRLGEIGGGLIEGTTEEERVAKWGMDWRQLDLGFEKEEAIIARGLSFIEEVKQAHPNKRVLVVSHGGFIAKLIYALIPTGDFSMDIGNTSVTMVELKDNENVCHLFSCTKHLEVSEPKEELTRY